RNVDLSMTYTRQSRETHDLTRNGQFDTSDIFVGRDQREALELSPPATAIIEVPSEHSTRAVVTMSEVGFVGSVTSQGEIEREGARVTRFCLHVDPGHPTANCRPPHNGTHYVMVVRGGKVVQIMPVE